VRPSTDWVLMNSAFLWKQRSTCTRAQVGVVISRNGRILASGYNGSPSGMDHCDHTCYCPTPLGIENHPSYPKQHMPDCRAYAPCTNVVHAEANALAFAARYGVGVEGADLHTTRVPCLPCAGMIINAGIVRVVWDEEHRDMKGLIRLGEAGLEVIRWSREG
jgi:dCMP deaminase